MAVIPNITLNSGFEMPQLGLGTWHGFKINPDELRNSLRIAIAAGVRLFDCAAFYGNEQELGEILREQIEDGTITREEIFITSKLWNTNHHPDNVKPALQKTLSDLQVSYLDMYLIHWPISSKPGPEGFPIGSDGLAALENVPLIDTWRAMEKCVHDGLVRSIGVSNFNEDQIQNIIDNASIKPSNHQFEIHPFLDQTQLINFSQERGMAVTAYATFAKTADIAKPTDPKVLTDETILKIATSMGKTPAQVVLRYIMQLGCIAVPKSSSEERIKQNTQIFDFELSQSDVDAIRGLNKNFRSVTGVWWPNSPQLPWKL